MKVWFASSNKGKVSEVEALLEHLPVEVHSPAELDYYTSPEETGTTFEENARIKAKSLKAVVSDGWVIADDSGLEVNGLNNLPGIHSARYAGEKASDAENTAKLLKMMQIRCGNQREARFVCKVVAYSPEGEEFVFSGTLSGEIAKSQSGSKGFGYDPVFVPAGETQTLAELGLSFKNKHSHRSQAIKAFAETLKNSL